MGESWVESFIIFPEFSKKFLDIADATECLKVVPAMNTMI